jgi:outer membrane protein assembly factor BamB
MKKPFCAVFLALFALIFLVNSGALSGNPPPVLFDVKTEKPVSQIYFVGENQDYILVTNRANIFVYNSQTGKLIWEDKVKGFTDEGLELIWNQTHYIVSYKQGMRCYELATGRVLWETTTPLKMKEYSTYFNFRTGFILNFGNKLMGFDPNNGQVKWSSESLDWNSDLAEENISNIYGYSRETGDRLLVLGKKVTQLLDAASGKILGTVEIDYNKKNKEPVGEIGKSAIALFGKKETKSLDLRSGKLMWAMEEQVDARRGYVIFDYQGKNYAVFALKKALMLFDLEQGVKVWETGEDYAMELEKVYLYPDGTLMAVGIQNVSYKMLKAGDKNHGCYTKAFGFDFLTGKVKYETIIGYSTQATIYATIPLINITIGYRNSVCQVEPEAAGGALFYYFGNEGMKIDKIGVKWDKPGNEGLTLMDPSTGQVKWRTDLVLWANWDKDLRKAVALKPGATLTNPSIDLFETPPLVYEGNYAYLNGNNRLVKIDLTSGKTVWESPQYGLISHFHISDGRIYGEMGYSKWLEWYDVNKLEAKDEIRRSSNNGYFILNEADGKEVWKTDKLKTPIDLFLHHYVEGGKLALCDGDFLRMLNLSSGKYDWQIDLKKELTGPISGEKGIVFVLTGVSRSTSYGYDSYTVTTTKTYDISMEHGVFPQPNGDLLVIAEKGPALVGLDGKVKWEKEWDWKPTKINFTPTITENGIIYQYKKMMYYISLKDGSIIWESKERSATDCDIFLDKDKKRIFIVEPKNITAYKL